MPITVIGDFADPLSFLASQRIEQIRSLGLRETNWLAVESDRTHPMSGRPLAADLAERVARLSLPGETVPEVGQNIPSSRAATAAYAESLTDGVSDAMRCALFDALWVHRRRVDDHDVIRSIVFDVLNPTSPEGDIAWRSLTNVPLVPLGDADAMVSTRRLGVVITSARGPLTLAGQLRLDDWWQTWRHYDAAELPLLLTDADEVFSGDAALDWLAGQLAHRDARVNA